MNCDLVSQADDRKRKANYPRSEAERDILYNLKGYPYVLCTRDNSTYRHYHTVFVMSEFH
jgi:hypothetical protein